MRARGWFHRRAANRNGRVRLFSGLLTRHRGEHPRNSAESSPSSCLSRAHPPACSRKVKSNSDIGTTIGGRSPIEAGDRQDGSGVDSPPCDLRSQEHADCQRAEHFGNCLPAWLRESTAVFPALQERGRDKSQGVQEPHSELTEILASRQALAGLSIALSSKRGTHTCTPPQMLQVERCPGSRHRIEKPPCFVGWLFDSILERTGVSVKLRGRSVGPETLGRSSAGVLSRNPPTGSETPSGVRTGFRAHS